MIPLYSPKQASVFFFLGGPLASTYFLYANFKALGKPWLARMTALAGLLLVVVLIPVGIYFLNSLEIGLIQIANFFTVRWMVRRFQVNESGASRPGALQFQPNRKVALVNLIAFLVFLILLWIELMVCISITGS